jgi:diguanylate cyclase (GGDEF)-like protein
MIPKAPPKFIKDKESFRVRLTRKIKAFVLSLNRVLLLQIFLGIAFISIHAVLLSTPVFHRVENIVSDLYFRLRPSLAQDSRIVLIEIAEDAIQGIGRWPWPRHYHAVMAHLLTEWGAKAVVFDMIFSEPSDSFDDEALREAIEKSGKVYLPAILEGAGSDQKWIQSLPELEKPAKGIGHINIIPDKDGALRRITPTLEKEGKQFKHLAVKVSADVLEKEIKLPLDSKGDLLINWAGPWKTSFQHYSYLDLIASFEEVKNGKSPKIQPEKIKDSICIIGLTATGHADIKESPLEASYPAVGVHANVINSILMNRFITVTPFRLNLILLVIFGFLSFLFLIPFRNMRSLIVTLAVSLIWIASTFLLFCAAGVLLPVVQPLLMLWVLFIFSAFFAQIVGTQEKLRLFDLATRDGLTSLFVIRHFRSLFNEAVTEAEKIKEEISVILIDIDNFKKVNDIYGHQAGDMILKGVAHQAVLGTRSTRAAGKDDIVARYGGEEIIIMLRKSNLTTAAFTVAERIRKGVESAIYQWENTKISVTISLGVSTLHFDGDNAEALIRRADEALYRAKNQGKNRVCLEDAPNSKIGSLHE